MAFNVLNPPAKASCTHMIQYLHISDTIIYIVHNIKTLILDKSLPYKAFTK